MMDRIYPPSSILGRFLEGLLPWPVAKRVHLVLDLHPGYALAIAPTVPRPSLIATLNRCPLYLSDLLLLQSKGIIAFNNTYDPQQIGQALGEVAAGRQVYQGPPSLETGLSTRERDIVRLAALGRSNRDISRDLHITEKRVRNLIPQVLLKLGLRNRVVLSHWYLGISPDFSGGPPAEAG